MPQSEQQRGKDVGYPERSRCRTSVRSPEDEACQPDQETESKQAQLDFFVDASEKGSEQSLPGRRLDRQTERRGHSGTLVPDGRLKNQKFQGKDHQGAGSTDQNAGS